MYEDERGWYVLYEPELFTVESEKDDVKFHYTGEAVGDNYVELRYIPDKQPQEVLTEEVDELVEEWEPDEEEMIRDEGYLFEDKWCYTAVVRYSEEERDTTVQLQSAEYNGGVILTKMVEGMTDENILEGFMDDALWQITDTLTFYNYPPQKEFASVSGVYSLAESDPNAVGQILLQLGDGLGCADTCDDILALCVDQVLTEDTLGAGSGVTGERNACAGGIAHVSEYHGLNIDSGTPLVRDIVHHSVVVGSRVVPGTENSLDGFHQLDLGILRELFSHLLRIDRFVLRDDCLQILSLELCVIHIAVSFLLSFENAVEIGLAHAHYDVGEHLDESSVGIVSESRIAGLGRKALDRDIIETEVQDRIHHTGHGCSCAGTDGNKKRILRVAELLALNAFEPLESFKDLLRCVLVDGLAVIVIVRACLSGNGETVRDRKTDVGHLRQVRALAAEKIAHVGIPLFK